jgi:hypothetical protein
MYFVLLFLLCFFPNVRLSVEFWICGFGSEFSPELVCGLDLGFRFRLWVSDFGCPDTKSDPNLICYHLYD